jgi:hypothetical protein
MIRWPLERWISLSAVVISVCAFALAIQQGCRQREHDRLTLLPHVFLTVIYNQSGVDFALGNPGGGPAIVHWFVASVDGEPHASWSSFTNRLGFSSSSYGFRIPSPGDFLRPGHEGVFLHIDSGPDAARLLRGLDRIELSLCYCSLYDECWITWSDAPFPAPTDSCTPAPETILTSDPTTS